MESWNKKVSWLTTPIDPSGVQRLLLLIPLCLSISIVYKTTRCERLREIPLATLALWVTLIGGMIGVVALVIVGPSLIERVTAFFRWLFRRPPKDPQETTDAKPPGRFARVVDRLGAPFLGVVGPLTIGGWAAALLGRASGCGKTQLIIWLALGQAMVTVSYVYTLAELTD